MAKRNSTNQTCDNQELALAALAALGDECQRVLPVDVWSAHRVLVAVSGGADSVALLRTLAYLKEQHPQGPPLAVVHVNHGLRGAESDADADFVKALSAECGAEFFGQSIDAGGDVSENGLRQQRYDAILKVAGVTGARYAFTGHHNDDHIETILFRIFRGTGLAGLRGIPAIRVIDEKVTIVRPFLKVARATVEMSMKCIGQPFRCDSSNKSLNYSRNFLRNALLPNARSWFGTQIDAAIVRLSEHAADAVELEALLVDRYLEACFYEASSNKMTLQTDEVAAQHPAVARAVLHRGWSDCAWPLGDMTRQRWQEVVALIQQSPAEGAVLNLPGNVRLEVNGRHVIMSRESSSTDADCAPL